MRIYFNSAYSLSSLSINAIYVYCLNIEILYMYLDIWNTHTESLKFSKLNIL